MDAQQFKQFLEQAKTMTMEQEDELFKTIGVLMLSCVYRQDVDDFLEHRKKVLTDEEWEQVYYNGIYNDGDNVPNYETIKEILTEEGIYNDEEEDDADDEPQQMTLTFTSTDRDAFKEAFNEFIKHSRCLGWLCWNSGNNGEIMFETFDKDHPLEDADMIKYVEEWGGYDVKVVT